MKKRGRLFNRKLILSLSALLIVLCINVFTVSTYAIWSNRLNDSKFMSINVTDENPSLKYQLYVPLDSSGNRLPGSLNVLTNVYTLSGGHDSTEVISYALVGWTGNSSVPNVVIPMTWTMTVNGASLTRAVYRVMVDTEFTDFRFRGNRTIESLVIPKAVRVIDGGAFAFMEVLKSMTIEGIAADGTVTVGEAAFGGCYAMTTINYDANRISGEIDLIFG